MNLTDEAYYTINLLRNTTWLEDDIGIEAVCGELIKYFNETKEK